MRIFVRQVGCASYTSERLLDSICAAPCPRVWTAGEALERDPHGGSMSDVLVDSDGQIGASRSATSP